MKASDLKPGMRASYDAPEQNVTCVCDDDGVWVLSLEPWPELSFRSWETFRFTYQAVDFAVSPVSDERVRELEEKLAEAVDARRVTHNALHDARADIDHACKEAKRYQPDYPFSQGTASEAVWACGQGCEGVEKANEDLHAELSTLRAQLEGQWELGEPLTHLQLKTISGSEQVIAVHESGAMECSTLSDFDYTWSMKNGTRFYLDPRPLPTLPSEPEPEVPAVPPEVNPIGVIRHQDNGFCDGFVLCVTRDGNKTIQVWFEETLEMSFCGAEDLDGYSLYLGPVLHPDGTTSPIEPTQELLEALEKE